MIEELPTVGGRRIATSNAAFERAALVLLKDELERIGPENGMAGFLSEAVRLAREYSDAMNGASPWQPIALAPKDGTHILAWGKPSFREDRFEARETYWREYGGETLAHQLFLQGKGESGAWQWYEPQSCWSSDWKPTHFRFLPEPPKE